MNKTSYVFTDISLNVPNKNRLVVVRESNGVLRKGEFNEREKMLQVYFPKKDKSIHTPKLFDQIQLEECLRQKNYLVVLKKACLRYEPNDPEYLRISHRVFEYINEQRDYDILDSTRFYGPMIFYLAWFNKMDHIIAFLLDETRIEDCTEVINLYQIINEKKNSEIYIKPIDFIQV